MVCGKGCLGLGSGRLRQTSQDDSAAAPWRLPGPAALAAARRRAPKIQEHRGRGPAQHPSAAHRHEQKPERE